MADRKPLVRVGGKSKQLPAGDTISKQAVGLGNVTNDEQAKASIYPNTAPSAAQFLLGQSGGAYAPQTISGDITVTSGGVATVGNYKIANAQLAQAQAKTLKGNNASASAPIADLTPSEARSLLELGNAALRNVGTTAGTVAAGDDSRLSDAREWTATTVSQADAEAGTATTRRAWTAQRVRQAIAAWWQSADAPSDNETYGRKNGAWVEMPSGWGGGGGLIGTQGGQGFGVGEYNGSLPAGFSAMPGASDKASANYGNYQYSDGSIMVFVPRFYYRIGHAASPRYATYGANAIDIVGVDTFATEAAANAAGYAMHRAFKDGGADKSGFFIDKYLASKTGTTSCKSIANADPISLTTNASYNSSNGMTGCTGILADAVVLARSRAAGVFNVASIFMYDALAKLALAHGQAATGTTHCAWYDASLTTNFPKGCNNGALADTNDGSVTYAVASISPKPKTRATANFAKTTHTGQECGVADLNGSMYQAMLGVTMAGTGATDTTQNTTGHAYILKTSVALASLMGGYGGANDAWGSAANLAANYDLINGFLPWTSATGWIYYGNGASQVFSGDTSGTDWLRSCAGVPLLASTNATGTSQFGNDGCYQYGRANLFPMASGSWNGAAKAGVFCCNWSNNRSDGYDNVGFRAAAYGS